jgi:SAM-dependent methyltransferase
MSLSLIRDFYDRPEGPESETGRQKMTAILSMLEPDPAAVFLDIGCYDGMKTAVLQRRLANRRTYGIDFESAALRRANSRGIRSAAVDLNQKAGLPFPDACCDCIHAGEVIEHLFSPDWLLSEIARLLKPSGYAVLTTPNLASWRNRFVLLLGWQPFGTEVSTHYVVGNPRAARGILPGHIRVFTLKALVELVARYGLTVDRIRCAPIGIPKTLFTRLTAVADFILQCVFPAMGDSIVVRVSPTNRAPDAAHRNRS